MAWNVSGTNARDSADALGRVLASLLPDVVLLDEVWETVTADDVRALLAPIPGDGRWNVHIGRSGGRQKAVVASRYPVRAADGMADLQYPAGALDSLMGTAGLTQAMVDVERKAGLAMTGAWVTLAWREVLFVPFDRQSAGYAGSPEDELRVLQATLLQAQIARTLVDSPDSLIILGGDANLVGSERPLRILEGVGRRRADMVHLADRTMDTWRNPTKDVFTPGRLDFLVYGGRGLRFVRGFPFEPAELTPDALNRLGLLSGDGFAVSDHLPIVGDFVIPPGAGSARP